jgi:hypothetical protein
MGKTHRFAPEDANRFALLCLAVRCAALPFTALMGKTHR